MSQPRVAGIALLAVTFLSACGEGPLVDPLELTPASVTVVGGNNQTGTVGQALPQRLHVRVLDAQGRGIPDEPVSFAVTSGGGAFAAGVVGGLAAGLAGVQTSALVNISTDASGEAEMIWTLGTSAGIQRATATVRSLAPAQFTATAQAGGPALLTLESGDDQLQVIGSSLDEPFAVGVADAFGNPVAGSPVAWQITSGNGQLIDVSPSTDEEGLSFATLVPGPVAEPVEVTATLLDLSPVRFVALGFAGLLDPVPDEFSTAASDGLVPPDIEALFVWREAGLLVVLMAFAEEVVPDDVGGPNTVFGYLEFDTDQDPTTGVLPWTDELRPPDVPGSTGMGSDFYVNIGASATPTEYTVWQNGVGPTGSIKPLFDFDVIVFEIPAALLGGDDLVLDVASIVGTESEPTDIAANDGHLSTAMPPALFIESPSGSIFDMVRRGRDVLEAARNLGAVSTGRTPLEAKRPWER